MATVFGIDPRTGVALDPVAGPHRPSLPDSLTGALNRGPPERRDPVRLALVSESGEIVVRGVCRAGIGREPRGDGRARLRPGVSARGVVTHGCRTHSRGEGRDVSREPGAGVLPRRCVS